MLAARPNWADRLRFRALNGKSWSAWQRKVTPASTYSDIPSSDWSQAVRSRDRFYRLVKQSTTVRIDADVLHWLTSTGRGYQRRLNAILRDAMLKDGPKQG